MKKLFKIFLLLIHHIAISQNIANSPFIDSLNNLNQTQEVTIVKELSSGNFIFTCTFFQTITNSTDLIILIDPQGNTLASLALPNDSFNVYSKLRIASIIEMDDSLIFAQSCITKPDSVPAIIYFITDKWLKMCRFGVHLMPTEPGQNYQAYNHLSTTVSKHPDNGFYALLPINNFHPDAGNDLGLRTYFRLDNHFNIVRSKTYNSKRENGASNLIYNPKSHLYFSGAVDGTSYILDSNFNELKRTPSFLNKSPEDRAVLATRNTLKRANGSYLLSGTYAERVNAFPDKPIDSAYFTYSYVMLKKFNEAFEQIDSVCIRPIAGDSGLQFGSWGWDKYGAAFQSMDFTSSDSLYFTYFDATPYFSTDNPGSYTLFTMDSLFNIRWKKKIYFDEIFELMYLMVTSDGGCLITGILHKSQRPASIYIAKHNAFGERTWVRNISQTQSGINLYPNPANEYIKFNTTNSNLRVALYSIDGKMELNKTLDSNNELDIQLLPEGLHFYKLFSQDGTVMKTGKVLVSH